MPGILGNSATWGQTSHVGDTSGPPLGDPHLNAAISEHVQRRSFEAQRLELGQMLNEVLRDEILFEVNRAFGTDNTRSSYRSDFKAFKNWCIDEELPYLPTSPEVLAHYLIEAAANARPIRKLERLVSAVAYVHQLKDVPFRTDDVLIRAALRWARRKEASAAAAEEAEQKPDEAPKTNGTGKSH